MRRPLCLILLLFLSVRLLLAPALTDDTRWRELEGQTVLLTGKAADLYEPADGSREKMSFTLESVRFITQNQSEQLNGKVICYLEGGQKSLPKVGSDVAVRGTLSLFREATNPGEFDAARYYQIHNYIFSVRKTRIVSAGENYDKLGQALYETAYNTSVYFWNILGEEYGALASAMVLGIKKDMGTKIKTLYQDAGIGHLLAISGLHVSMIGMLLFSFLQKSRLPAGVCIAFSCIFLTLYGEMTGMGVSTLRALIMFFLLQGAKAVGRTADVPTSLAFAAAAILMANPYLVQDAGFQLSFSAVLGIALVVPVLREKGLRGGLQPGRIQKAADRLFDALAGSLGINLAMMPFLLTHYYKWNPWSLLANLVVIPLMSLLLPLLLLLAGMGAAAGYLVTPIAQVIAWPIKGIFWVYEKICRIILLLPKSTMLTGAPDNWKLLVFLMGLGILLWQGRKIPPLPRMAAVLALIGVFVIKLPGTLTITMLDVGQGECVCVETPEHEFWILDAGSTSKNKTGQYQIIPFLEYSGADKIGGILVSHWDEDHVSALEEIFIWANQSHIEIGTLVLPDTSLEDEALKELLALAKTYEIQICRAGAGDRIVSGQVSFYCLHPYDGQAASDRNEVSLAWKLNYELFSAIFTGDLQMEGEAWLVKNYEPEMLDCDLLDAGHHGAANAVSADLLNAATPKFVLISCGKDNQYGHPAPETLGRIADLQIPAYITAECGAVTVRADKGTVTLRCFLE